MAQLQQDDQQQWVFAELRILCIVHSLCIVISGEVTTSMLVPAQFKWT